MVARDVENADKPAKAKVHPLLPLNEDQEAVARCSSEPSVFDGASERQRRRKQMGDEALSKQPPTAKEVPILHELWRSRGSPSSPKRINISDTQERAVDVMQPQNRNQNGFMFGGFLMRRALEVGWLAAYRCCQHPPYFAGVDEILFRKPVRIGCLLEYTGRVVYASPDGAMRVYVEAHVLNLSTGEREQTNEFHIVFNTHKREPHIGCLEMDAEASDARSHESQSSRTTQGDYASASYCQRDEKLPGMQPDTYEEAMLYLEGRRRCLASLPKSSEVRAKL